NHTSRTSRRLQLVSESSMRYERGVDDRSSADYSLRAAILTAAVAGGVIEEGVVDCYPLPRELPELEFRIERFARFVGANIPLEEIMAILMRLGCTVTPVGRAVPDSEQPSNGLQSSLRVIPPSYRPDLLREIDLYEEVLRVWGMNRVQPTLPGGRERTGQLSETQAKERQLGRLLRSMGLNETMTYAFVPPTDATDVPMGYGDSEQLVELINPLSSEMSVLRRSILPGLLRSVAYNLHHGTNDIKLYEMGTVFHTHEGRKQPKERQMLAAVLVGAAGTASWNREYQAVDFFDAKGILETIGRELNIAKLRFKALTSDEAAWLQSGRAASVLAGSSVLGWIGEVHPRVARAFDIDVPVIAFELEYSLLIKASQLMRPFVDIPLFPAVQRDLAVVVDESVTSEQVSQVIKSAGGALLSEIRLFDVFTDTEKLGAGKKSLAFSLSYRAADRTLISEEVEYIHQKVLNKVTSVVGGEIRA
ncbi:MAG: phenylalanine--tRNA ligase subunit beta, partial [Coriobacteriales bacterium]|nr:phenylalanine--tRNA ligase subunit beta [Coriobacteriales bacterium]